MDRRRLTRQADDDDAPTVANGGDRRVEDGRPAGRVDDDLWSVRPAVSGNPRSQRIVAGPFGGESPRAQQVTSGGDGIEYEHVGATISGGEGSSRADRAGAEHNDMLTGGDPAAIDRMDGHGNWFDERGLPRRELRGRHEVHGRHDEVLLQGAVVMDADDPQCGAHVGPSIATRVAPPAGEHRPHRDAIAGSEVRAGGIDVFDDRREFVAHDPRQEPDMRVAELVAVEMKVGAADPHGLDAHHRLARRRRARIGSFIDLDAARCCRDGDLHREGAGVSERKAITSSATRSGSSK